MTTESDMESTIFHRRLGVPTTLYAVCVCVGTGVHKVASVS